MSTRQTRYEFPESVPVAPVASGTNIVVTTDSLSGGREVTLRLLTATDREGALFVSPGRNGADVIADIEAAGATYDPDRMAVIDCTDGGVKDERRTIRSVSAPNDLTGIGMTFTSLYERLYNSGFERVRSGVLDLAPLVMYVDEIQPVYRFLHTVTGRVRTADGLGVFALNPATLDDRTYNVVTQPFDSEVSVRETEDGYELRTAGLDDQPTGWQPLDDPRS